TNLRVYSYIVRYTVMQTDDFRIYLATTFLASIAMQAQSVAVGWQVYRITGSPLSLGYVGLMQFLPMMAMTLPPGPSPAPYAGRPADRSDRRLIMFASSAVRALTAGVFVALSVANVSMIWPFYAALAMLGAARAFAAPAADSLLPQLVAQDRFADAVAWTSSS